jgi:hypothetical protein
MSYLQYCPDLTLNGMNLTIFEDGALSVFLFGRLILDVASFAYPIPDGVEMPGHRLLVGPHSSRFHVDIKPRLDHPNVIRAPQPSLKLSRELGDLN